MSEHKHFVVPLKYYIGTFVALLFLTFITVFIAQFHFGVFNLPIAMLVAVIKASLVIMIFMGLKWDKGFNLAAFLGSIIFLVIFFLLTFADIGTRKYTDEIEAHSVDLNSPVKPILHNKNPH